MPLNNPILQPLSGFTYSASAVTLALEKIERENLLPNVNIT
jgi:hypothetical protein